MSRFYFHLDDDGERIVDLEGREWADLDAAIAAAVEDARAIVAWDLREGRSRIHISIEIATKAGVVLHTVSLDAEIAILGAAGAPVDEALTPRMKGKSFPTG